ncbi:MAG: histidine kinase [Paenibacillus sp.]|nr:histidine kinase [Paenibacillus sp.]
MSQYMFGKQWLFSKKMIISYLLLIMVPVAYLLSYFYYNSKEIIEKEVTESMLATINQVEINVSYRLSKVNEISDILVMNSDLHQNLKVTGETKSDYEQLNEQKSLSKIMDNIQTSPDIRKIRLFVDESKIYANEHVNFFSLPEAEQMPWYDAVVKQNGGMYWITTYSHKYLELRDPQYILSGARIIKDPDNYYRIEGVVLLDIPLINIASILESVHFNRFDSSLFIIDENAQVIAHPDLSKIGAPIMPEAVFTSIQGQEQGIHKYNDGKDERFAIFKTIPSTGWKIVTSIPAQTINHANATYSSMTSFIILLISFLLFMLAVFVVFGLVTENMVKRITQITLLIRKEGIDTLDEPSKKSYGSVVRLEKSVDHMIATLRELINKNYGAQMREREAQLKALQAQINPHFLYNTLDSINWMALTRGATDISMMINALAAYFRLSLNRGKDIVTVEDELNLARVYLDIQKKRFPDFNYEMVVEEEVLPCMLPKLTLQPVIENALLHGIQNKADRIGTILISGQKIEEGIMLTVEDNGVGMDRETIDKIMNGLSQQSGKNFGLYNVHERLTLFTGEAGGIHIMSKPGEGTKVVIRMPHNKIIEKNQ